MEKFMTKKQIKNMFTYMGYDEQAKIMLFKDFGTYFIIECVDGDIEINSYSDYLKFSEFLKFSGTDCGKDSIKSKKAYIKYYKDIKKVNEFRAKARMYNAYCEKKFSHIDIKCSYDSTDILRAIEEYYKIINSDDFDNLKAGLPYLVKMYSNGLGIGGFDAGTVCAYAVDKNVSFTRKKDKFVRVVHAVREWYREWYKATLNEEIVEEYYA